MVRNGGIGKEVLQTYPFNRNGGEIVLFKDRINIVKEIVSIIDRVNG